jgi:hypothetical protein
MGTIIALAAEGMKIIISQVPNREIPEDEIVEGQDFYPLEEKIFGECEFLPSGTEGNLAINQTVEVSNGKGPDRLGGLRAVHRRHC